MGVTALLGKVALCSFGMGLVSHLVYGWLSPLGAIVALAAAVGGGVAVYGAGLLALQVEEATWVLRRIKSNF